MSETSPPVWSRMLGRGAITFDFGHGIASNARGDVVVAARFDSASGARTSGDVVLLDARGAERWRLRIVEAGRHRAPVVAMGDTGAVYVVGAYLPAYVPNVGTLLSGASHLSILKLGPDGRPAWCVPLAPVPLIEGRPAPPVVKVAADPLGGACVVIGERGACRVVRVSDTGCVLWDRRYPIDGFYDPGVGTDEGGDVTVWGCFSGAALFEERRLVSAVPARFLARINLDGRVRWAHVLSTLHTVDYALTVEREGGVALAGVVLPKDQETRPIGAHDLVLARLEKDGTAGARRRFRGDAHTCATVTIAGTGRGGVAMAGYLSGALTIAGHEVRSVRGGNESIFVASVGAGAPWARTVNGPQLQAGLSVHGDESGGVTIGGWFAGSAVNFGNGRVEVGEEAAFFVARYG